MNVPYKWHCTTISGHFFTICMFIFHKTEVQTVILRCLMSLNLDWFKSYGLRCSLRPRASLANSQKISTDKWPFYDHIWPFSRQLHLNLSQNCNWYKRYDTKRKNTKNVNACFCTKLEKKKMEIFMFCVITFEPIRI